MEDGIYDLTDLEDDDVAMTIQRVNDYLDDSNRFAEFWPQQSEDDQYRQDVESLIRWVNASDLDS